MYKRQTLSSNAIKEAAKDVFRQAESKETPVFASGSGTKSDPYLIRTAAQLQAFAAAVNGGTGYEGQYKMCIRDRCGINKRIPRIYLNGEDETEVLQYIV